MSTSARRKSAKLDGNLQRLVHLNDDEAEKQARRESGAYSSKRQSLVVEARESLRRSNSNSPVTLPATGSSAPAPILANFEQWMKLVKDNKINATNSWNFALIDYFHDMSLLRDGDGINFQRASYTLDGCVKIYTSRVDSVATETGKLLSGLADAGQNGKEDAGELADDSDNEDDDDAADAKKKKQRKTRSEATLASDYDQLSIKKFDFELAVDPLFRKMCADFDEGGAKGLLLNSLMTDKHGRVVFDGEIDEEVVETEKPKIESSLDIDALKAQYFPNLADLDELEIAPSLPSLYDALNDPTLLNVPLVKELQRLSLTSEAESSPFSPSYNAAMYDEGGAEDFDDVEDLPGLLAGGDENLSFGEYNGSMGGAEDFHDGGASDGGSAAFSEGAPISSIIGHDNDILAYFDETLKKNWAGPEHWKIAKLKSSSTADPAAAVVKKRAVKKKEVFFIDFLDPSQAVSSSTIFAESSASINLPKAQQRSKTRNLLPSDEHFSSKNLVRLFLRPKDTAIGSRLFGGAAKQSPEGSTEANEDFWAQQYVQPSEEGRPSDYDQDFFQDDGGADDFDGGAEDYGGDYEMPADYVAPAEDGSIPGASGASDGDMTTRLLAGGQRARPEYVNYARSAKRVNVRLLKDNLWKVSKFHEPGSKIAEEVVEEVPAPVIPEERKFSEITKDLKSVYAPQQMSEISTSFCFICVLHLANEKGLIVENNEEHTDLSIRWDPDVPRDVAVSE